MVGGGGGHQGRCTVFESARTEKKKSKHRRNNTKGERDRVWRRGGEVQIQGSTCTASGIDGPRVFMIKKKEPKRWEDFKGGRQFAIFMCLSGRRGGRR